MNLIPLLFLLTGQTAAVQASAGRNLSDLSRYREFFFNDTIQQGIEVGIRTDNLDKYEPADQMCSTNKRIDWPLEGLDTLGKKYRIVNHEKNQGVLLEECRENLSGMPCNPLRPDNTKCKQHYIYVKLLVHNEEATGDQYATKLIRMPAGCVCMRTKAPSRRGSLQPNK